MAIAFAEYVQDDYRRSEDYAAAKKIADELRRELEREEVQSLIASANSPGNSSAKIQDTFLPFAERLGFRSEAIPTCAACSCLGTSLFETRSSNRDIHHSDLVLTQPRR